MGKKSRSDVRRLKQPYVSLHAIHGVGHQVFGYTPEYVIVNELKKDEDPQWGLQWEQHDLGLFEDLQEARQVAKDWREGLIGQYEVV